MNEWREGGREEGETVVVVERMDGLTQYMRGMTGQMEDGAGIGILKTRDVDA